MKNKKQNKQNQLELDFRSEDRDSVKSSKADKGKVIYLGKYTTHREHELLNKIISLSNHLR